MSMFVAMDEDRQELVLQAALEVDALARVLPGMVPNIPEAEGAHFLVRAMAGRLLRLASVLMSAAGDSGEPTERLARVLYLQKGQG